MQVTYFLNAPMFNMLFIFVILFYIERKLLFLRNLAAILPLKYNLPGKLECFNTIDGCIEITVF